MVAVQERTLKVWAGQIQGRVIIGGKGPPLVFFHGPWGFLWDNFLDSLAQDHTVYVPEHPGTTPGDPDAIKALDDLWDLVLYYYELFDQLGLEAPDVVGHSFGGMVAAEIAATNPKRVKRLVLLSSLGLWRDDAPVKNWMSIPEEDVAKAAFYAPEGPVAKQVMALPAGPEAQTEARIKRIWTLGCTGKFVWPIPDKGLKKRLHRILAPTLIVWGRQDGLAPAVYAQEFAARIPGARAEIVEEAAHHPHLEQMEAVSRLVGDFFRD